METIILTAIGTLVGAIITWFFAWIYYKKAGSELHVEVEKLRQLVELVLYIQFNPAADVSPKRDKDGKIVGIIVSATASA
jgi:hypothetical protein